MSRFTGPQHEGASRELRVARRAEAGERQRAGAERDRQRAASSAAEEPDGIDDVALRDLLRVLDGIARLRAALEAASTDQH